MISPTQRDSAANGLLGLLTLAGPSLNRVISRSFREELKAAAEPRSQTPSGRAGTHARQVLDTLVSSRQNLVNSDPVRAGVAMSAAAPILPPAQAAEATSTEHASIVALKDALKAAGIETNGIDFQYVDETVGYPGGSYQNRLVTVTLPGGVRENYGADLVLKNPRVTVVEIQNLLGRHT